ncbi:alpha/beta hydrolase [Ruminococcus sp. CLA-AA-H200]|uniref:Alpha/beta hydrolase n=1 Tax=Ruminococcus turbiniformis TaxID=2881258 RepID=A0ABS8FZW7_9FIRM|nr:alpha/beta hydrolase [Ruminococcus turbiniformis]MCC2255612.1 alpha/beta hydrolase [Ruminococcus turbiniformis]
MSWKRKITFLSIFCGTAVGTMHVVNRLFSYLATADDYLHASEYNSYDWRFGKISYKKKGTGAPLLLIHNLNVCASSHEWNRVEDELSRSNTVYTLDLLGCGCSDHPLLTYTNFLYVQMITDFIKDIIKEKTDVIVSGDSSPFVLMACANDDTIINRVAMINPQNLVSLAKSPTKRSKMVKYFLSMPVFGTFVYNMKVNKKTIHQSFVSKYFYNQNEVNEKDILTCFEASHMDKSHSKYLYACLKSRFTNANITFCLNKLTNSIFIITGNSNPENILSANQYQNYLPSIEIVGIDNTKQIPHVEKPAEFVEQIKILFSEAE